MRRVMFCSLIFWLAGSCFGQSLCPKHIEIPTYPPPARGARVQWKVTLKVTIDAEGTVKNVEAADEPGRQAQPMLQKFAIDNMKLWTFEKPASAPVTQVIVYEYKFDRTLPINDHQNPITKVTLDLPDRVTILANEVAINPSKAKRKN